jgi:hypothetical protein
MSVAGADSLDGVWQVSRRGGLLPPLLGVRKRIEGARGWTTVGPVRWPFDVVGLELQYHRPFRNVVDVLCPDGDGYLGRATVRGRPVGSFRMTRA